MAMTQQEKEREAAWLESAMRARGWENKDVARETGLDPNWISQWKIANRPIPDLAMLKLARAFGESPFDVRPSLEDYAPFFRDYSLLDGLSDADQDAVMRTIKGMRAQSGLTVSSGKKPELALVDRNRK